MTTEDACVGCGEAACVNVTGTRFCSGCFRKHFVRKCGRIVLKLPEGSQVFVLEHSNETVRRTARDVLALIYQGVPNPARTFVYSGANSWNGSFQCIRDIAMMNNCSSVVTSWPVEDQIVMSMVRLSTGGGGNVADCCGYFTSRGVVAVNIFGGVLTDEVAAYYNIRFCEPVSSEGKPDEKSGLRLRQDSLEGVTRDFVADVGKRDRGLLHNFASVLRRINRANRNT